jgi:hypothetical protein
MNHADRAIALAREILTECREIERDHPEIVALVESEAPVNDEDAELFERYVLLKSRTYNANRTLHLYGVEL